MKFCQTDGTLLLDDAPPADPYKTVVANQDEIASAIPPLDPFKTMVAPPSSKSEDILQLPEEPDQMKTMVVSQDDLNDDAKGDVPPLDLPSAPIPPSAPLIEPKPPSDFPAAKSNEPSLSPPSFGDLSSSEPGVPKPPESSLNLSPEMPPSPFDSKSPYGDMDNKPIPSPFQDSMPPGGYQPPSVSPFDAPKPPPFKEAEPAFGANQSPFEPPSPFGQQEPFNPPAPQTGWTPPPAPVSEWQNQELGANTPFQPPPAAAGQDQTLAIVSLVCGILSIFCCGFLTGIPAMITGYMAKNNVDSNPNQYGGRGLALAGMITGGIGIVLSIIGIILQIALGAFSRF